MKKRLNRTLPGLALIVLAASLYCLPVADWVSMLVSWGQQHPLAGPVAYVGFVVVATVLFLPGSIAMMIGGFLFGFAPAFLCAVVAVPLGAQGAFAFGRWVARPWVRRNIAHKRRIRAMETALQHEAFTIVVLSRLSLIIPFNVLNYAFGATAVRASTHLVATTVGMLPAITLYVYLGTLARDIGQILSGDATPPKLAYWILGAGIAGLVAVTSVIHRTATRALDKHIIEEQSS